MAKTPLEDHKCCGTCLTVRPLDQFYDDPRKLGQKRSYCKLCARRQRANWYANNRERRMVTSNAYRAANRSRYLLIGARNRAKRRGLEFDLELSDMVIPDVCPLLGIPIVKDAGPLRHGSPTVDRIDPSKGYTRNNVWIVSARANLIKQDATHEELDMIASNLKKRVQR